MAEAGRARTLAQHPRTIASAAHGCDVPRQKAFATLHGAGHNYISCKLSNFVTSKLRRCRLEIKRMTVLKDSDYASSTSTVALNR